MSMMFKMLSTVPLNVLLAFHDVDKTGELAAKIPELMTPESLAEAVNAVLSSDWSANALAVYNLLLNAQLIVSDERRRAALLRALTGNDGKLVFAAGLHMQRFSWPAAMDAELLNALLSATVRWLGPPAQPCFAAALPHLVHPIHTPLASWLASNHTERAVKTDALNWIVFSLYGSSPLVFQEVLCTPDAAGFGGAPSAVINPDSLASVTMKFNMYCQRRALAPDGVTVRPSNAYVPCYDEFAAQDAFPELDFDAICQMSTPFRAMDSDGDGLVDAGDVDNFFRQVGEPDAPTGTAEVRRITKSVDARSFTLVEWIRSCASSMIGVPQPANTMI